MENVWPCLTSFVTVKKYLSMYINQYMLSELKLVSFLQQSLSVYCMLGSETGGGGWREGGGLRSQVSPSSFRGIAWKKLRRGGWWQADLFRVLELWCVSAQSGPWYRGEGQLSLSESLMRTKSSFCPFHNLYHERTWFWKIKNDSSALFWCSLQMHYLRSLQILDAFMLQDDMGV